MTEHAGLDAGQAPHAHDHDAHGHAHEQGGGCCSDTPEARARFSKARRLVAGTGLAVLAVAVIGVVVGGWFGAALLALVAVAILGTVVSRWGTLSLNDRLMPIAVAVFLLALALLRALPR